VEDSHEDAGVSVGMPGHGLRAGFGRGFLKENWRYLLSVGASVVLTVVLLVLPLNYRALGNYGYLGVFLGTLLPSATVIFPSPTLAVAWIGGRFLNPALVGLLAGAGATLGEMTGYTAGFGGSALAVRSRYYAKVHRAVDRYGWLVVALFAFIPNPLFDLAGIAAGATRMPVWKFLLACALGKVLRFVAIAYLGRWGSGWDLPFGV